MSEPVCEKTPHKMQRWIRLLWISAFTGSLPAVLSLIFAKPSWLDVLTQIVYGVVFSSCIGSVCTLVLPRIARPLLRLSAIVRWPVLVGVLVILAAVGCLAATFLLVILRVVPPQQFVEQFFPSLKISILITLIFGLSTFSHEVVLERYNRAKAELAARAAAEEKLRQAATEARLSSLESRVQPHFLFNTLNSVLALIREDPAAAERMVERLATLLRFSLDANQSRLVPLALEAKIIRDYLEIEQARFGSRLRYSIEIPAELDSLPIPPMSLQTVVENSVKYAVSSRREGATILLRASVEQNTARIEVTDDGPGFTSVPAKPGHGLELLQNRVEGLFGEKGSVEIGMSAAGGASVTVIVPYLRTPVARVALAEVAR